MARKTKGKDVSDDLLKPCFKINPYVQLKEVPTNGEEYLLKVMKERQNYAEIAYCKKDFSQFAKNQNSFIEQEPEFKASDKLIPTIEWQNVQLADFSKIRLYVSSQKEKECNNIMEMKHEPHCLREWRRYYKYTPPTLSRLMTFKSALVDDGLENITKMLNEVPPGGSIDYRLGQWTYSLLACVRHPLLTETTCVLRELAKKCREIRSRINPDDENAVQAAAPLNIIICIVGRYFEAKDLADYVVP